MLRILKDQRGFTLIELVIIIILIGVLAGVAIPRFVDMRTEAQNAKAKSVEDGMRAALALDFADDVVGGGDYTLPAGLCSAPCDQPDDAGLTTLHNMLEGAPTYPGPGTGTGGYDGTFGTGFYWYITADATASSPVRLYGMFRNQRVDTL